MGIENITPKIRLTNGQMAYVGTISHATLRDCDVLPALMTWLACFSISRHDAIMDKVTDTDLHGVLSAYETATPDPDLVDGVYKEIQQAFDDLLPDGFVFCTHPGDGSDLGIWPTYLFD